MSNRKTKLMGGKHRVESTTDFPGFGRRRAASFLASVQGPMGRTMWMARIGYADNASIHGHQPPRVQAESSCRKTKMHCAPFLPISAPPSCIFASSLRTFACGRVSVEGGGSPRASSCVREFKADGIVKKILAPHRRRLALFSYYKISDVQSNRLRAPSSLSS
ncbi:hypothetical protein C8R44DRAFT_974699 [Mycena epipterygia]|nr:hypothetical protein C8R44DRAFT_974699 [Mycena epipterygia]